MAVANRSRFWVPGGITGRRVSGGLRAGSRLLLIAALSFLVVLALPAAQTGNPQEKAPDKTTEDNKRELSQTVPLPKGKRLFLKDGSFHLVREYERKDDRVRFYSIERSSWEEIPAEIVDWDATRKAEAEEAQRKKEIVEKIRAAQAAERAVDVEVDASVEVAPGVFLPGGEGAFVVEGRTVTPLSQVGAEAKLDKRRLLTQIIVPVPVVPTRHKIQIPGKHAGLRLATAQPEFYMRTADAREPEMELIRAEVKGDVRLIEVLSTQVTGQHTEKRRAISLQRWQVAKGLYRLTISQSLEPGEYALAEILPDGMNLFVWDFGVDASSPRPASPEKRPGQGSQDEPGEATPRP
ncbi:MAG: hypothetical protein WAR21_15025 [Candidatus Acidiferrales bacterium]|jgi:hypothetical protein